MSRTISSSRRRRLRRRPLIVVIVIVARVVVFSEVLCLGALVALASHGEVEASFIAAAATAAAVAAGRLVPIEPERVARARG